MPNAEPHPYIPHRTSSGRGPVRRTRGTERVTHSTDVSVGNSNGSQRSSSEVGDDRGGGGGCRGDHGQESSTEGVTTASSAGSSLSALTSASASRSCSSAASSSSATSSSAASSSSLTSSSYDCVTPSASTRDAESRGVRTDDHPTPSPAPAAADDGAGPVPESWSRRRPSMQRPLTLGPAAVKTRASHSLLKGRGKSKLGGGGGGAGRGRAGNTWKNRRGSVVRLVSRKKNISNAPTLDILAAGGGGGSSSGAGGGGGRGSGSISSNSGGSHRSSSSGSSSRSGGGANDGRCKLQEFSFWVACGPAGEV